MADSTASEEEAREYAESIINTVREPLIVLDQDFRVISASPSFYDAFKVEPEKTVGRLIYELANKQWDIPELRQLLETILPLKTTLEAYEVEHEFADLGRRTMLFNAREIPRKSGEERFILLAIEDITERKRQENLLSESEERYRRLYETANDGIVLLEKAEGKITHANPAITEMMGYSHDELIGKSLISIGFPDDIGGIQEILQTLEKEGILHYKDSSVQTKTGQLVDTDIYMVDKTSLVQCNIRDITERKRMEKALRASEERYRLLVEASNDLVWTFDLSSMRYTYCSKSVETILGYSQEEVNGAKLDDIFPPETKKKLIAAFDQVFKGESNQDQVFIEAEHRRKDGSLVWMEISAVMHRDNLGQPVSFTGVSRDITERKNAEEALRRSENYYRALFETSGTAMFIIKVDTTISLVNSNFEELSGYLKQEVEGKKSWTEFVHPDDLDWMKKNHYLRRQNPDAAPRQYEFRFITRHGEKRNILLAVDMISGTNRSIASCIDITERKQMEEELSRNTDLLRSTLESTDNGILVVDNNGKVLTTNNKFSLLWQIPEDVLDTGNDEKLLNHVLDQLSDPEYFMNKVKELYSEPNAESLDTLYFKDGRIFERYSKPLLIRGSAEGRVWSFRDVTEREKAEEALRRSETQYRRLYESIRDAILVADTERNIIDCNQAFTEMFGYSLQEIKGMKTHALYQNYEEYLKMGEEIRKNIGSTKFVYSINYKKKSGEIFPGETNTFYLTDNNDEIIGFIGMIRDITERKKAAQEREALQAQLRQSQKMEAIGTLAGGIAHDFNNILSSVLGYTELSLDEVEKGSLLHQNLSQVLTAGNRAKGLVKQILDFGRKEGHEFMPTPIVPLVKEALKMLRSTFPSSIEIKENISIEQAIVYAEPTQLHQVIVNLATNAKQAMSDEGGILEVTVETVRFDENIKKKYPGMGPGNYVRITVNDKGCGISEQYLDRIFEPYFSTSETGTGTGLGLSVVHGIVKTHKGHITVSSKPGEGTTFHVYLPLAEQERSPAALAVREGETLPTGTESVLIVDDEKPIIKMQQQILEGLGYQVTPRTSSVEALEAFRANPEKFDIVITDMTMPNMTGDKLALKIKEIRSDVPVILSTGFSERIDDKKMEDLGLEGFMLKPATKTQLANTVRKVLGKSGND